jgi:uncharacterized membrane-anchored protein
LQRLSHLVRRRADAFNSHHCHQAARAVLLGGDPLHICTGNNGWDLATEAIGLGFQLSVVAFGALIAVIGLAYNLGANPVLTFWLAYVLTRPLGASLGDLLSQSRTYGDVGLGTIYTSIGFLTVIVALVAWVSFEGERTGKTDPVR